ncbi:DUF6133 family protein [Acetivibrio cellulolyticus]|uniref:DUF6133 family protein n=1 Tax=Acetivibrio cellulolyticus TaxID=35830 RepID=UPI0001E2C76A|nr:DUF6133 family protein [Acetivibrio cellulolyticus]
MSKFMKNTKNKAMLLALDSRCKASNMLERARKVFYNKDGQGTLDVAVTVLISIVLGALILAGLYLVINNTVLPTITQKIKDMFNFKG